MNKKMIDEFGEIMMNIYADRDMYSRGKIIDMAKEAFATVVNKNCNLQNVIHWVAIEDKNHPEQCTEVLVKFENGDVRCRYFDGDMRYYNVEQDIDITDMITHWAALPQ